MADVIHFYKAHDPYGFMSNFYEAPIMIDNKLWKTTEHYYQAQKFLSESKQNEIRMASTPNIAARFGRKYHIELMCWDDVKFQVMYLAVLNKFLQHPNLARQLIDTGDAELIEHTIGTVRPDAWWGDGHAGEGRNWLGKILMKVRTILGNIY